MLNRPFALLLAASALLGCAQTPDEGAGAGPAAKREMATTAETLSPAAASATFGFDLYKRVAANEPGNITLSPASISAAFALAYEGARGETARELEDVLNFPPLGDEFRSGMAGFQDLLDVEQEELKIAVANSAWFDRATVVEPEFLAGIESVYGASEHRVDFRNAPDPSRIEINNWVEERTNKRIVDLLGADDIDGETRFALVNAIYFNGSWERPFEEEATEDGEFRLADGGAVTARMMRQEDRFRVLKEKSFDAVSMPYTGGAYSLVIFLPKKDDGLAALEDKLNAKTLAAYFDKLDAADFERVHLMLPQYEARLPYKLKDTLISMGMPRAFSNAADFTGMVDPAKQPPGDEGGVKIGDVIHQTFIRIDEAGTEAAAATAIVGIRVTSAQIAPPFIFHADHPFFFALRHNETGAVLFMGRVSDPT